MDDERTLIARAQAGDQAAFAGLVRAYQAPVYNLAYRMLGSRAEAEEAAQEAFLRAYRHLHSYQRERKLSSWLLSIAAHHCIDRLRRRPAHVSLAEATAEVLPDPASPAPEAACLAGEQREEIQALLAGLPAHYRLALVLRYWHDLSYEQMATVLGTSQQAVKSRLHRAREMAAAQLAARRAPSARPHA